MQDDTRDDTMTHWLTESVSSTEDEREKELIAGTKQQNKEKRGWENEDSEIEPARRAANSTEWTQTNNEQRHSRLELESEQQREVRLKGMRVRASWTVCVQWAYYQPTTRCQLFW